jgi:hypothetical protein
MTRSIHLTGARGGQGTSTIAASLAVLAAGTGWFDGAIVVVEDDRALTERDVTDVLGMPVIATVPADTGIARATDAGLLLTRLHRLPLRRLAALVRPTNALTTTPMQNVTDLPSGALRLRIAAPANEGDLNGPISGKPHPAARAATACREGDHCSPPAG